jgi:hypothetical protein
MFRLTLCLLFVVSLAGSALGQLPERRLLPPRVSLPLRYSVEPTEIVEIDGQYFAKITLESLPGCAPCERWKREVAPAMIAAGWHVETVYVEEGSVPRWRVCIGDRCWRIRSGEWLDNVRLSNIVNQWRVERLARLGR